MRKRFLPIACTFCVSLLASHVLLFLPSCKDIGVPPDKPEIRLDSTSHDFVWRTDALGDGNASILRDVVIIDENNIWAVGEIYVKDSAGQFDPLRYNAARWNGATWNLSRVSYHLYNFDCTVAGTYYGNTKAVFALDASNVVLSDGFDVVLWNGNSYSPLPCRLGLIGGIEKFWGTSANDFYAVGTSGGISRFLNGNWQKLASGTNIDIRDIWGTGSDLWACGYRSDYSASVLLHSTGVNWEIVWNTGSSSQQPYYGLLVSVWGAALDSVVVVGGEGIYRHRINGMGFGRKESMSLGSFPNRIGGQAANDMFIVGYDGMIWHYNGASWKRFNEFNNPQYVFFSVAVKGNTVVAVGADYGAQIPPRALAVVGKRLQ